jgi:hypothetical protein
LDSFLLLMLLLPGIVPCPLLHCSGWSMFD